MSLLDDVKSGLQTRQGKVVAVVLAGGLGYLWWTKGRAAVPVDPGELGTTDRGTIEPRTGGGGGGTTQTPVADNETWLSKAVSALSNPPYNNDPGAVYDALRRALDGLSLTSAQQALVSKAIGIIGTPPEGMPPLNSTQPEPPPTTADPDLPFLNAGVRAHWLINQWIRDVQRTPGGNPNLNWGLLVLWNPDIPANVKTTGTGNSEENTFRTDAVYRINWTGKAGQL